MKPPEGSTLERARSLTNEAMWTVKLQYQRLGRSEPEDDVFVMRWWADLEFFLVAVGRLERAAKILITAPSVAADVSTALLTFRSKVPYARKLRNVGEHIDAYAVDSPARHHHGVSRRDLQVGRGRPGSRIVEWRGVR